jgi:SAM-dependent methyltransferase
LEDFTSLSKDSKVLDIGSGIGRIAIPLTKVLEGEYHGIEPVKKGVKWCQKNITKVYPNFQFRHIDLSNDLYNSSGADAANYIFPFNDNFFEIGLSVSVFTHMLPDEVENYFHETARTLQIGGYFVASFFLIQSDVHKSLRFGNDTFEFKYNDYCWLMDEKVKSANVAYLETFIFTLAEKSHFVVERQIKGYWNSQKNENQTQFQDVLIMKKNSNIDTKSHS